MSSPNTTGGGGGHRGRGRLQHSYHDRSDMQFAQSPDTLLNNSQQSEDDRPNSVNRRLLRKPEQQYYVPKPRNTPPNSGGGDVNGYRNKYHPDYYDSRDSSMYDRQRDTRSVEPFIRSKTTPNRLNFGNGNDGDNRRNSMGGDYTQYNNGYGGPQNRINSLPPRLQRKLLEEGKVPPVQNSQSSSNYQSDWSHSLPRRRGRGRGNNNSRPETPDNLYRPSSRASIVSNDDYDYYERNNYRDNQLRNDYRSQDFRSSNRSLNQDNNYSRHRNSNNNNNDYGNQGQHNNFNNSNRPHYKNKNSYNNRPQFDDRDNQRRQNPVPKKPSINDRLTDREQYHSKEPVIRRTINDSGSVLVVVKAPSTNCDEIVNDISNVSINEETTASNPSTPTPTKVETPEKQVVDKLDWAAEVEQAQQNLACIYRSDSRLNDYHDEPPTPPMITKRTPPPSHHHSNQSNSNNRYFSNRKSNRHSGNFDYDATGGGYSSMPPVYSNNQEDVDSFKMPPQIYRNRSRRNSQTSSIGMSRDCSEERPQFNQQQRGGRGGGDGGGRNGRGRRRSRKNSTSSSTYGGTASRESSINFRDNRGRGGRRGGGNRSNRNSGQFSVSRETSNDRGGSFWNKDRSDDMVTSWRSSND